MDRVVDGAAGEGEAAVRVANKDRDRRKYLGGHDAARIVGVFPYGAGAADTYARIVHGVEVDRSAAMARGLLMEPGLIDFVEQTRGIKLERDVHLRDDVVPFFGCSIDALEVGGRIVHECKSTLQISRHRWGVPHTDDVPREVWIQCQWEMGFDDRFREAMVWVFFVDGDEPDPLLFIIRRDATAIAELREKAEAFWFDHIVARVPPLPGVWDEDAEEVLRACYPVVGAPVIDAGAEVVQASWLYAWWRFIAKAAETEKKKIGARIEAVLGKHEGARWRGGSVSWKSHPLGTKVNWEAVAYELAKREGTDGLVFNGLIRENTHPSFSVRSLRVHVRGANEVIAQSLANMAPPAAPEPKALPSKKKGTTDAET